MFGRPCSCRSKEDRLAGPDAGGARFDGVNERHRTAVEIGAGHDECGRALGHAEELRARLVECGGFGALVHGAAAHARMLLEKRKDGARALRREVWDEVPCGVAHPELGAGDGTTVGSLREHGERDERGEKRKARAGGRVLVADHAADAQKHAPACVGRERRDEAGREFGSASVTRHDRAAARRAPDEPQMDELRECGAHGVPAHAVVVHELGLRGQETADGEAPREYVACERLCEAAPERRAGGFDGGHAERV